MARRPACRAQRTGALRLGCCWSWRGAVAVAAAVLAVAGCTPKPWRVPAALPIGPYSYTANLCPDPLIHDVAVPPLGPQFSCGVLTVPQNRTHPKGKTVTIAVARLKSASPTPRSDPLLMLAGGPGGTGLIDAATRYGQLGLNRDRDVLFIDQRGTLHAHPFLGCPELDTFTRDAVALDTSAHATRAAESAAVLACRTRLAGAGADLASFDTSENAADLAALRLALKIPSWDVYGVSYGTDLALQYLRNYPRGIRSEVLDSNVPPQLDLIKSFWGSAAEGFDALSAACAAQAACHAMLPDLKRTLIGTINHLAAHPVTVRVPLADGSRVPALVDGYKLANLVITRSLIPGGYTDVPAIIAAASRGDVTPAATAIAQAAQPLPSPVAGYGLAYGVFCREGMAYTSRSAIFAAAKQALPEVAHSVLRLTPQSPYLPDDCTVWNVGKAPALSQHAVHSNVPVLLLAGALDEVTAPSNAQLAASTLSNAHILTFPDAAHGVLTWSACGPATVIGFFNDPVRTFRPACLKALTAPTFTTTAAKGP